ncbi:MAG TPA: hypothetical protein EYN06_07420 [Myxococcales bacterium]|nr:hypothetical protein [Myxococcales bacterium]HIN86293.1 hypothetical protein [Myxococcales bacterium]
MKRITIIVSAIALSICFAVPAMAQDKSLEDHMQNAENYYNDAMKRGNCGAALKACGNSIKNSIKGARGACSALRSCKKGCKSTKKAAKGSAKDTKKACLARCPKKKAGKTCRKACKKAKRGAKKAARGGKRACFKECRAKHRTPACKKGRFGALGAVANCAKKLVKNADCKKRVQAIGKKIKEAIDSAK